MKNNWKSQRVDPGKATALAVRVLNESVRPNIRLFVLSWVCVLGVASATSGLALATRYLVNNVFVERNAGDVWLITSAIVLLSIVKGFATYFQSLTVARVRRMLISGFQNRQFAKLMHMELGFFGKRHPTEFVSDLLFNARGTASVVLTLSSNAIRDGLTLAFLIAVMVAQDPLMSICALFLLPVVVAVVRLVVKRMKQIAVKQVQLNADVTAVATEAIEGIKVIKSFGLEARARKSFRKAVSKLERNSLRINRIASMTGPIFETLGGIVVGLFVLYASWQSLSNGKSPGEYMAFIVAFLFAYEPAKKLANVNVDLQKQFIAVDRYYELLDRTEGVSLIDAGDAETAIITNGEIELEDVSFEYEPGKPALTDVSFTIQHGSRVAIVGRSGSGKTTTINLILGFLSPDRGRILIGGNDIAELPYYRLRQAVSLIAQDVFLFEGSIRDNIRDGNPSANEEQIQDAANYANVTAFAKDLPNGLDTQIGPNGTLLSGGQRQRVSIARALIKDAPILIYDEATSALDGESERVVMSASSKYATDRTIICIAHRLSTIRSFERIIVLDDGHVVDSGTYDEVVSRNGTFRSIFHIGQPEHVLGDGNV